MASQDASAEDFKAAKYSLQNVSFRSIKRARDMFLADHGAMPPQHEARCDSLSAPRDLSLHFIFRIEC